MRKIIATLLTAAILSTALVGCGGSGDAKAPLVEPTDTNTKAPVGAKVIQMGHIDPASPEDPYHMLATYFGNELKEISGGTFEIDVLGDAQLGGENSMVEGMKMQTIDSAILSNFTLSSYVEQFCTFDMPYLFENSAQAHAVMDSEDVTAKLKEQLYNNYDVQLLGYGDGGFRSVITTKKAIVSPADFKSLKIRVPGNTTYLAAFEALGANPITMPSSECIPGLQQKTIDAMEQPIAPMYSFGGYEICRYISMTEHLFNPIALSVSKNIWESLSEQEKEWFNTAAQKAITKQRVDLAELEGELVKRMISKANVEVNYIEDKTAFREAVKVVYSDYETKFGTDMMSKIREITEKLA